MSRVFGASELQYFEKLRFGRALRPLRSADVPKRTGRDGRHRVLPAGELPNAEHRLVERRPHRALFSLPIRLLQLVFSLVALSGAVSGQLARSEANHFRIRSGRKSGRQQKNSRNCRQIRKKYFDNYSTTQSLFQKIIFFFYFFS